MKDLQEQHAQLWQTLQHLYGPSLISSCVNLLFLERDKDDTPVSIDYRTVTFQPKQEKLK